MNIDENIKFSSTEDVKGLREKLTKKYLDVMELYEKQTNNPQYTNHMDYVAAAIYHSLRKVFPEGISFRIDYRTKSYRSMQKSTDKEILDSDLSKLKKDIFGMKVVITDIDRKLDIDSTNPQYQKIIQLQNKKLENLAFISKTRAWLTASSGLIQDEENYYKIIIELLKRIQASTYSECDKEVEIPYSIRLGNVLDTYSMKKNEDIFSLTLTKEQKIEIDMLLNDLEKRLDDMLERELLNVFLPKALNTSLISDLLQISYNYEKTTIKPNGYVADFYHLNLGKDFNVELQTQSYLRYLDGKKGFSFHNGKVGKSLNINSLFELVDKDDPQTVEYYIKILNKMPISVYENSMFEDPKPILVQKVEDAYKHIKVKDKIKFSNKKNAKSYDMRKYLLKLAEYVSANISICRSSHNFSTTTANIENGSLLDDFSDVLRKRDGISCLAQLLVDKVESILKDNKDIRLEKTNKQYTVRDIMAYCNTLPTIPETNEFTIE